MTARTRPRRTAHRAFSPRPAEPVGEGPVAADHRETVCRNGHRDKESS
ncbi:hypothetical protein SAMN04490357_6869 [Streptomyces misionensis]|uniref:Uncharacterized protein n=1 Tax=Streptomyces misionensis TaxID=67331 RepID=A0A1H5FZC7_9ACTN|nr:hypothetical protein SAMN04490357_6869 [Streptomyces misionensis]SFY53636.1 hypothetical protein STEPF1_06919 [Streptomyces sp. F-1]